MTLWFFKFSVIAICDFYFYTSWCAMKLGGFNTIECRYNAVQYIYIFVYIYISQQYSGSIFKWIRVFLAIETPDMRCLLWAFSRNWPCYNGTTLCDFGCSKPSFKRAIIYVTKYSSTPPSLTIFSLGSIYDVHCIMYSAHTFLALIECVCVPNDAIDFTSDIFVVTYEISINTLAMLLFQYA